MPFQAIKTRSSKSRNTDIFLNGLTKGLSPKMAIFPRFLPRQYRPRKCLLRYSRTKKMPFQGIKTRCSKSRKNDIFLNGLTHGFGPKMTIFPTFFFQAIKARAMSFTIFQNEKSPFQAIKRRSLKSRKIEIFLKRLTHGIGPKMAIFPSFFLRRYRPEKCVLRYSRTKKFVSRL